MFTQAGVLQIVLPGWLAEFVKDQSHIETIEDRMRWVIAAAQQNIMEKTGGPFAAAVFESDSGKLISLGVNLVTSQGLSMLHAEMLALSLAQLKLGTYDLGSKGLAKHDLVTSAEPCAMCFGALPWSGIRRLICAARAVDTQRIGFDEGPKPRNWRIALAKRQIEVIRDVQRGAARQVFADYVKSGGVIYNSRA